MSDSSVRGAATRGLETGALIAGRYRVEALVGRGGYGAVYRAVDEKTGKKVALKYLHQAQLDSDTAIPRFEREAAFLLRLVHPKIVRALDFGYEAGAPYLVTELLDGVGLDLILKAHGAIPAPVVAAITLDVLDALAAAHAGGIVHRDIKPANVFLPRPGTPGPARLLDFGIARALVQEEGQEKLTATGQSIGTPAYLSPEQAYGRVASHRSDIYSLGLTVSEMLSGTKLVVGGSELEMMMLHAAESPHELPAAVRSSPLSAVVERAVAKAPEDRFATATEMARAIAAAVPSVAAGRTLVLARGTLRIDLVQSPIEGGSPAITLPNRRELTNSFASGGQEPVVAGTLPMKGSGAHAVPARVSAPVAQVLQPTVSSAPIAAVASKPRPSGPRPAAPVAAAPPQVRAEPRKKRSLWAFWLILPAAAILCVVWFATRGSAKSSPSKRKSAKSAEPAKSATPSPDPPHSPPPPVSPTPSPAPDRPPDGVVPPAAGPRGLAQIDMAELDRRITAAGYTIDAKTDHAADLGSSASKFNAEIHAHNGESLAEIWCTTFDDPADAEDAPDTLRQGGYATYREDKTVLSVRIPGDPDASRVLLEKIR